MKKIFLLLLLLAINLVTMFAQSSSYDIYLENAKKQFVEGNYESAGRNLAAYQSLTDKEEPVLKSKIDKCLNLLEEADSLSKINKKEDAIKCYYKLLDINPNDEMVFTRITELKKVSVTQSLSPLYRVGTNIYQNKQRLKEDDLRMMFVGTQAYDIYDSAVNVDIGGLYGGLYGVGVPIFIAGAIMQLGWAGIPNEKTGEGLAYGGIAMMGVGAIMIMIPPIVETSVKAKIKKAVNIYNYETQKRQKVDLSVSLLPNGIGMKCVF